MNRQAAILSQVLTRTTDRDAAVDCTAVYFANGLYGRGYDARLFTDEQLLDRILNDVSQVRR